jgi:hypothetical protein
LIPSSGLGEPSKHSRKTLSLEIRRLLRGQVGRGDTVNVLVGIALFLSFFLNPQPDVLSSPLFFPGVRKLTVRLIVPPKNLSNLV